MPETERPVDQMTGREWAEVKVLIAAGNLEVVTRLSAVTAVLATMLAFVLFKDGGWLALPVIFVCQHYYLKSFTIALKKAQDYAEKSDFRW